MKAISISLAKIDYDYGEPHLHLIASAPSDFTFNSLTIIICTPDKEEKQYAVYEDPQIIGQKRIRAIIPLSQFFESGKYIPSIYKLILTAENNIDPSEEIDPRELWLSDVHGIYRYFIDELMSIDKCTEISNDLIQKYLLLYGHQQALSEQEFSIAMEFFTLMHKGFSKCENTNKTVNCGCYDRRG